jgi:cobalt-zinc-cadmium efflux system outer membrane protein
MKTAPLLFAAGILVLAHPSLAQAPAAKPVPHNDIRSPSLDFMPPHDMIDRIMAEAPDVLHARARVQAAEAEARARAAGPHEFTLRGEYVSRASNIEGHLNEWTIGVARGIRLPGKADADERIGNAAIAVAENSFGDARHQTATLIKTLYLDWVLAEAEAVLADEDVRSYERQLAATERSRQLGQAATLQVEQVQTALAQARATATGAAQARLSSKVTLQRTFPSLVLPARLDIMPDPAPPPGAWDEWRAAILDDNHELKIAQSEAERRDWLAKRAAMDRFADPTFELRTFQERSGHDTGFGIGFSMPIGGAQRSAAAQQAAAESTAAAIYARKALRDLEIAADRDIIAAQQGLAGWRQTREAAQSSGQMLTRMQRAVQLGDQGLTELLLAQRQDYEVRRAELRARAMAHAAVLQLMIDAHRVWSLGDE